MQKHFSLGYNDFLLLFHLQFQSAMEHILWDCLIFTLISLNLSLQPVANVMALSAAVNDF